MPAIVVLATTADVKTARQIANLLVQKRLAACVSIREGFFSTYRWKGKVECAKEVLIIIKTASRLFGKVKKAIIANHPYDLPEIIAIKVSHGSKEYLQWIEQSVTKGL